MKTLNVWAIASLVLAISAPVSGQEESDERREHRGPPPVAFEACVAAVEGDVCFFEGRRGETLEGLCTVGREESLACRPNRPPPSHGEENRPTE